MTGNDVTGRSDQCDERRHYMSGPGPAAADGHVVLNSGYGLYGHMLGNLLLVFKVAKEE